MDNTYSSVCFKKAKQLLLILKTEIEDKKFISKILVFGYGEDADVLVALLKGSGYDVCSISDINGSTFDTVILLEHIAEDELIKLINKGAYVIDAAKYDKNEDDYYMPSHYKKIRVIALSEK